jgi:hypothetical protein
MATSRRCVMKRLGSTTSARAREMRGLLKEWERSGATLTEFARKRGVRVSTLSWWRFVFRHAGKRAKGRSERTGGPRSRRPKPPRAQPSFFEVKLAGAAIGAAPPVLEVVLRGGQRIRVPRAFDPVTLRALVAALESPC